MFTTVIMVKRPPCKGSKTYPPPLFFFQIYELRVMETKPDKAVSIIECDMNVRPSICWPSHKYIIIINSTHTHARLSMAIAQL